MPEAGAMTREERAIMTMMATQRHNWEQGVCMQALLEAGKDDYVIAMSRECINRQLPDGRTAAIGNRHAVTDPCACGEALLYASRMTKDPCLEEGLEKLKKWVLTDAPRSASGVLYHVDHRPEFWVDSLYMLPPFLAAIGKFNEAVKQYLGYYDALYDPKAHLMRHIFNQTEQTFPDPNHWATGNGWTLAAIVRLSGLLPRDDTPTQRMLRLHFLDLSSHMLQFLNEDASFCDVLDDSSTFHDYCSAMMTAYALYRASSLGWISRDMTDPAHVIRSAVRKIFASNGGWITPVCAAPSFDRPGYSPEAQAFYLLMETAGGVWELQHR